MTNKSKKLELENRIRVWQQKYEGLKEEFLELKRRTLVTSNDDCSGHSMYLKAQAIIEDKNGRIAELEYKLDQLKQALVFQKGNQVKSEPDYFTIDKKAAKQINESLFYFESVAPIKAIVKLRNCMEQDITEIEIGWRVVAKDE